VACRSSTFINSHDAKENSKKPIYEIHKWWARRLGHVFRILLISSTTPAPAALKVADHERLLSRFYKKNDLRGLTVLDPFMGGGTSVVEALKCGARVIGVDIDPVAWFVTKKEVEPFDERRVVQTFNDVAKKVERALRALYVTIDPKTATQAEIVNAILG